jgi:hypothetical protein
MASCNIVLGFVNEIIAHSNLPLVSQLTPDNLSVPQVWVALQGWVDCWRQQWWWFWLQGSLMMRQHPAILSEGDHGPV